jgi:ubiquinone/menaquinone biosynthesis C-methylase UbiE
MSQQQGWYQAGMGGSLPELYERDLVPTIFAPWAEDLMDLAALRPGEHVLDVACGTGVAARCAASRVGPNGRVVGLDLNVGMLGVARSVSAAPTPIEWQEGNAMAMPFPDGMFDVVLSQQGLQYFPDRAAGLREMRRVLRAGGRVALAVWRPIQYSPGFALLAEALAQHLAPGLLDGPFSLSDAEALRRLLDEAGYRDVVIRPATKILRFPSAETFLQHYIAASPLAEPVGQADAHTRAALAEEVTAALQPYVDHEGLAFPIENHLAMAHV